jgi:hypothetical protein
MIRAIVSAGWKSLEKQSFAESIAMLLSVGCKEIRQSGEIEPSWCLRRRVDACRPGGEPPVAQKSIIIQLM